MIQYSVVNPGDTGALAACLQIRLEMLRQVNGLPGDYAFSEAFLAASRAYYERGDQTTILAAAEGGEVVGCATLCYMEVLPTFDHPTGRRAHLMNVYTRRGFRRQGIAARMVALLQEEAERRGVTEISLDATAEGWPLYQMCGFAASEECMVMDLKREGG